MSIGSVRFRPIEIGLGKTLIRLGGTVAGGGVVAGGTYPRVIGDPPPGVRPLPVNDGGGGCVPVSVGGVVVMVGGVAMGAL
ncbi:MAG TPA: hypothetical protein VET48_02950 [Steroidobacteraceae bacterium]|nr:hypothetical protein [Steroidobacteraceae bacterium]